MVVEKRCTVLGIRRLMFLSWSDTIQIVHFFTLDFSGPQFPYLQIQASSGFVMYRILGPCPADPKLVNT